MFSKLHLYYLSLGVILLLISAPVFGPACGLSYEDSIYPLCVLIFLVVLWIFLTLKHISKDVFNFYSLFVLSAVLFNGGQALLEVLHLNENGVLEGRFSPEILASTLYLVALSLASFHLGGILCTTRKRNRASLDLMKFSYPLTTSAQALRIAGYIFITISIIPAFMLTIDAVRIVMANGYFALYQQDPSAGLASGLEGVKKMLSGFFTAGLLFSLAGSKKKKVVRNIVFIALFIQFCTLMFMGYRSHGVMLFLASLWVWHRVVKPIPVYKTLIMGMVLLFVIFPTINLIRNIEGSSRLDLQFLIDSYLSIQSPAIEIIKEMGGSMGTVAHTLTLIPQSRPFALGATYAWASSTIIPNVFWSLHPAIEHGCLGRWITMTVAPETFFSGGGLGFSFIAEAYANFGLLGTPVIMMLAGFLIAKLTQWAEEKENYERIAFVSGCIACMLFWPRADVTIFSRDLYYYIFFPYLCFVFIRRNLHEKRKLLKHESPLRS